MRGLTVISYHTMFLIIKKQQKQQQIDNSNVTFPPFYTIISYLIYTTSKIHAIGNKWYLAFNKRKLLELSNQYKNNIQ